MLICPPTKMSGNDTVPFQLFDRAGGIRQIQFNTMYKCDVKRMEEKIKTFSKFGDAGHGGVTRYSLSPEAHQARDEFVKRMKAIGAAIETDDMANMYATIPGSEPGLKKIVMASHADSVKNGGNYDGILGVLTAMEVLETVAEQNIPHRQTIV